MSDPEVKGPVAEFKDRVVGYRKRMDDSLEVVITSGTTVKSREDAVDSLQNQLFHAVTDADQAQHDHVVHRRNAAQDVRAAIDEMELFHGMLVDGLPKEPPALMAGPAEPDEDVAEDAAISEETESVEPEEDADEDVPVSQEMPAAPVEMTG